MQLGLGLSTARESERVPSQPSFCARVGYSLYWQVFASRSHPRQPYDLLSLYISCHFLEFYIDRILWYVLFWVWVFVFSTVTLIFTHVVCIGSSYCRVLLHCVHLPQFACPFACRWIGILVVSCWGKAAVNIDVQNEKSMWCSERRSGCKVPHVFSTLQTLVFSVRERWHMPYFAVYMAHHVFVLITHRIIISIIMPRLCNHYTHL